MTKKSKALSRFYRSRGDSLRIRWYESWVVKSAAFTALVLFGGYAVSLYYSIHNMTYFAKIAHDPDVEIVLGKHLESLKEVHSLRQLLVTTRLQQYIPPATRLDSASKVSEADWLKKANVEEFVDLEQATLRTLPKQDYRDLISEGHGSISWVSRDSLKVFNVLVSFPQNMIFLEYRPAEELRQRYQLLGEKLPNEIGPAIIKANIFILIVSFIILIGLFLFFARSFKLAVEKLLQGFSRWSEIDSGFRFSNRWSGELRLITAQFNAMAEDVEANRRRSLYLEKIASWQTIARKLAHEIKNPLTPIQMMVSQLSRHYKGDDAEFSSLLKEAQTIISEEVDGLRRMVDNFSQFARLPVPQPKRDDLVGVVSRAVELQKSAFGQHQISFHSNLKEAFCEIDADLIRQVILNLIKNAAEALGEKPGNISLTLGEMPKSFRIQVKDNGPGVPQEMLSQVFEAYFTTKHTGPAPGMGLGLAICQKIIVDHQGELSLVSKPGETVFTIIIPKPKAAEGS